MLRKQNNIVITVANIVSVMKLKQQYETRKIIHICKNGRVSEIGFE